MQHVRVPSTAGGSRGSSAAPAAARRPAGAPPARRTRASERGPCGPRPARSARPWQRSPAHRPSPGCALVGAKSCPCSPPNAGPTRACSISTSPLPYSERCRRAACPIVQRHALGDPATERVQIDVTAAAGKVIAAHDLRGASRSRARDRACPAPFRRRRRASLHVGLLNQRHPPLVGVAGKGAQQVAAVRHGQRVVWRRGAAPECARAAARWPAPGVQREPMMTLRGAPFR